MMVIAMIEEQMKVFNVKNKCAAKKKIGMVKKMFPGSVCSMEE